MPSNKPHPVTIATESDSKSVNEATGSSANGGIGAESITDKAEESNRATIIKTTSLCVVAMTTDDTSGPSHSLITGCSMLSSNDTKIPVLLVYHIQPKTADYDKLKVGKSVPLNSPDMSDDMYDFFLEDEQLLDNLPIPTLPLANTQSSLKDGELSHSCHLNRSIPLYDFNVPVSIDGLPVINNIIPILDQNIIAVTLCIEDINQSDEFNKPVGALVLYNSLSIVKTEISFGCLETSPYQQLLFNDVSDIIVNMSTVQLSGPPLSVSLESTVVLACITKNGSLKLYNLSTLDLLAHYSIEGLAFSHVVSCDLSLGVAVLATRDGLIHSVEITMETKEGIPESDDTDVIQLLSG